MVVFFFSGSRELQTRTSGTQRSLWEWCESCTPQHCVCPQKGLQHVAKFCPSCRSLRATSRFRMHTLPLLLPLRKGCGMTFQSVTRYVFCCCCSKSVKYIMKVSNSGTGILIISYNRMKTSGCSWKRPHHSTPGLRQKSWMLPFGLGWRRKHAVKTLNRLPSLWLLLLYFLGLRYWLLKCHTE